MKDIKQLTVPLIEGLEKMNYSELDLAMETGASKGVVNEVNWPKEFPYCPDCVFSIARSKTHLAVLYHVRGLDLRATEMNDNGITWEDSCCEFFLADPYDGTYYNCEITCIGTLKVGKGVNRNGRWLQNPERIGEVIRHTTLPRKEINMSDKIFGWSVGMVIPFDFLGLDPEHLPLRLMANFYKCGDKTAHPHFLSWNKVKAAKPDFHRPECFGELILK
jgi:hypothetical protein